MEKEIIKQGVVAEYNGKYWGETYSDSYSTSHGFTDIEKAKISDAKYCLKPTDMTYGTHSPYHRELSKATLKKVTVNTTYKVED